MHITLKLPTDYDDEYLAQQLHKRLTLKDYTYQIDSKSLDARDKNNIHWAVRVLVCPKGTAPAHINNPLILPCSVRKQKKKAIIVGSGPAGFFAALVLQQAGLKTTIIERGAEVSKRALAIQHFETTGEFDPVANYAFGEGGAGTFSDGKLTSRTKHISAEKQFILSHYIKAGAPEEIVYLAHPHLGTDNLQGIVQALRLYFQGLGGEILFETKFEGLSKTGDRVQAIKTSKGDLVADYYILAIGNSAHDTYRQLIRDGVRFLNKGFAIGFRMEHHQELINQAQWGKKSLLGVKAAEYRLTCSNSQHLPVYSFCMCPGGIVVPAAAFSETSVVNGMSYYERDGKFANAGCVAGFMLDKLLNREVSPLESLDWLSKLEHSFYNFATNYQAPFCSIKDYLDQKSPQSLPETSYPLGLTAAPLWELVPALIANSIRNGLQAFCRKLKGFETGILLGLESKTSSPIQVLRNENRCCDGFTNLFMIGEGSGFTGGIISSGVDGIKAAIGILD